MKFHGQFGQDKHLITEIYKDKKCGFFIEAGAYDGIYDSNTYILEQNYNWTGICVEANPTLFQRLITQRKCVCFQNALYNQDDVNMDFIDTSLLDAPGIGGLTITNSHKHISDCPIIKVTTKRLETLLDSVKAPTFIEYLSLDTEGSEYDILKDFNFEKYKIGYMCIEHNFIEDNRQKMRNLLESKGYRFYRENNVDDDYILNDIHKYI
jgi:FkbM family methyltransferase